MGIGSTTRTSASCTTGGSTTTSSAAEWFKKAATQPGAPNWLIGLAATTLAVGGSRESSRQLWTELLNNGDAAYIQGQARHRLQQLDAMDAIDQLAGKPAALQGSRGSACRAHGRSWSPRSGFREFLWIPPVCHSSSTRDRTRSTSPSSRRSGRCRPNRRLGRDDVAVGTRAQRSVSASAAFSTSSSIGCRSASRS